MHAPESATSTVPKNLPPLAGVATLEEAARPGLGIEACVARLKRATIMPSFGCMKSSPPASPPSRSMS